MYSWQCLAKSGKPRLTVTGKLALPAFGLSLPVLATHWLKVDKCGGVGGGGGGGGGGEFVVTCRCRVSLAAAFVTGNWFII